MTTVNSNFPVNLFVAPAKFSPDSLGKPQINLLPEQRIQAMVVEAAPERTVLEINQQRYQVQGGQELQVGQKLNLQVLQTQPVLELKVLNNYLHDRLRQTLPLLVRPFDWSQLVGQLRQLPEQGLLPQPTGQLYRQLQQLLAPATPTSLALEENISNAVAQLRQLVPQTEVPTPLGAAPFLLRPQPQFAPPSKLSEAITQLIKNLQSQVELLPKQPGMKLPRDWYVETRNLLAALKQGRQLSQLPPSQRQPLLTVLRQIQQHPGTSPQLKGEVKQVLTQLNRQFIQDISQGERVAGAVIARRPAGTLGPESLSGSKEGVDLTQLSASLKQLLIQNPPESGQKSTLPPELLGKLEGLLARAQQLTGATGKVSVVPPGLELLAQQLEQLVTRQPDSPQGRQLGLLSQLLGLSFETELLQGRPKEALASLKLSLLNLQKNSGAEVDEPLHRLELFQLCKAKLAEDQVQFLPLPFNQLDEGYLLAEKRPDDSDDNNTGESPLQMSLSLRLSALGNLRIDMLYDQGKLHLRLAGEDRGKMDYLQGCSDELKESVQAVELQGISFSADARSPARQLQQRLLPDSSNMLDARI